MLDIPVHDRPRERLLTRGVHVLSERELVALILRNGRAGESALDLAGSLLTEYGGLCALAAARPEELARRSGIGLAKASALVAAFQIGRLMDGPHDRIKLRGPADIAAVAMKELSGLRRERVLVLVCDASNRLSRVEVVADGSVDRSLLPVREILNVVLRFDGRAFAVAHNHPSGDPTPSEEDRRGAKELLQSARVLGLRFLDHVIVAGDQWRRAEAI